jgi:hypothetical protein
MKEEYLEIIKNVGFQDIRVVAESSFPIESLICETAESARVESPKISAEQLEEVADSVLSIKIGAVKPSVKRT